MSQSTKRTCCAALVLAALAVGPVPDAAAQGASQDAVPRGEMVDARWLPWLGCWQLWEEELDPSALLASEETAALLDRTVVCVLPRAAGSGVNLTTTAGDRVLVERTLVADGARHQVRDTDCPGWERSEWSRDGRRLFTHAELQCSDQPTRTVRGISLLSSSVTWIDIQVVEIGGRQMLEIRRYHPMSASEQDEGVAPAEMRKARREAAAPFDLNDVVEGSSKTSPRAIEALLVETEPRLALDSEALTALDDVGISNRVIDLLVALAYPDRFVVERRGRGGAWSSGGWGGFSGFHDPIWYDRYYPYYVTPFGYSSWGRGDYPYLLGGYATPFVAVPGGVDDSLGRAVRGQGYTRVSPRATTGTTTPTVPSGVSSGGTVTRRGYSGGSSGTSTRSGGTSTGRRAVPRR